MTALWLALFSVVALGGGFYMADKMMGSDDPLAAGVPEIFAALDDVKDAAADVDNHLALPVCVLTDFDVPAGIGSADPITVVTAATRAHQRR